MIIEDHFGVAALRGYPDGVYFVTQDAACPVFETPDLRRRLEATCERFVRSARAHGEAGHAAAQGLFAAADGAVWYGLGPSSCRLDDHPELVAQLVKVCRRTLGLHHPADAWEVD